MDDGYTGTNFERPDFKRMIELVKGGTIDTVIVKDMSRFGRDYLGVGFYTEVMFPELDVRFIAIMSGVDSSAQQDTDFIPFLNIINEWYAKDTDDPKRWIVDEEAAQVVRRIYDLCMDGYSPAQIAGILRADKVLCPAAYAVQQGRKQCHPVPADPCEWHANTVARILSRREYLGHTVNFKTFTKSYKDKKIRPNPEEKQMVLENTQEPIVPQKVWDRVQELRSHKRRPCSTGKSSIFSGLVYCADCGRKLYYCTTNHFKAGQDFFVCSNYRSNTGTCFAYYIR